MGVKESKVTEGMKGRVSAAGESEIGEVEEVEFAAEWGFGATRTTGEGIDAALLVGQPADDEAGFRVGMGFEDDALGGFVHGAGSKGQRGRLANAAGVGAEIGWSGWIARRRSGEG
jgi:hypothetical protein